MWHGRVRKPLDLEGDETKIESNCYHLLVLEQSLSLCVLVSLPPSPRPPLNRTKLEEEMATYSSILA